MARKKVKLVRITNDSTRRATFKKRKQGLLKKISELATLCNVSACMIVYSPEEAVMQPEAWPSAPEAARIVVQFRNMPLAEQRRKMLSQEGFLRQRATKLEDQLRRAERENRELSVILLVHEALAGGRLPVVGKDDAAGVAWAADSKLKEVRERINKEAARRALLSAAAPVVEPVDMAMESVQANTWLDSNGAFGEELIMPMPYTNHVGDAWIKVNASINARELVPLSYVDHGNNANWQMDNIDAIGGEEIFPVTYAHHANNAWLDGNYCTNGEEVLQMPYVDRVRDTWLHSNFPMI